MAREQSGILQMMEMPAAEVMAELFAGLDAFVGTTEASCENIRERDDFSFDVYRHNLRQALAGRTRRFDTLPSLDTNLRTDRARRFVTLIYMEHEREVVLHQQPHDILVIPRWH